MFYCFFRMDWLTFQFYIVIWVLCTSVIKAQLSNPKMSHCVPGQPVPSPDKCNSCICYEGEIFCTNLPCPAPACTNGETLPNPDACNKCMCDNNKVACSDLICIPAPQCIEKKSYPPQNKCNVCMCLKGHIMCTTNICTIEKNVVQETFATNETIVDDGGEEALAVPLRVSASVKHVTTGDRTGSECDVNQPVYKPDDCNECYCFEGRLVCSDIICMRGSKCVEGQEIPKPDRCNSCRCIEGHILCTNRECPDTISKNSFGTESRARRLKPNEQCENGEAILPPPPPNDCNTCTCLNNRVICSHRECHDVDFIPDIKTRFITAEEEKNERNQLKEFDKQLSVEPIVDILLKSHEKRPSKLVRTHAYNGFQQEIKVHSGKISKDTSKLLKALATSLHNPALADIGDKLLYQKAHHLTSTNGDKINLSTKNSFDVQEIPVTQTSKIITSGSQGNETILVIPELSAKQNHVTVTPIMTHRGTNWNTVASPPPILNKNLFEMYPHEGKESNLLENQDSSKIITNKKHGIVNDLNKFDYLGQEHGMTLPRIMVTTPMGNSYSENLALQLTPHPINVNNGRPYSNHNDQYEALQYETRGKYADSFVTPTSNYSLITSAYEPSREYETYQIAPQNPYTTSIPIQLNENSINGNGNDYGNDNGNGNSNGNGNANVNGNDIYYGNGNGNDYGIFNGNDNGYDNINGNINGNGNDNGNSYGNANGNVNGNSNGNGKVYGNGNGIINGNFNANVNGYGNGNGNDIYYGNGNGNEYGIGNGNGNGKINDNINGNTNGNGNGNSNGNANGNDNDYGNGNGYDNINGNGNGNSNGNANGNYNDYGNGNGYDNINGNDNGNGNGNGNINGNFNVNVNGNGNSNDIYYGNGNGNDYGIGNANINGNGYGNGNSNGNANGNGNDYGNSNGNGNDYGNSNGNDYGNSNGNDYGDGKPNQVLSRLTEPNVVPVTTYTLLTSRHKPRQDRYSYHNVQYLDTNISKMTVQKTQMNSEANRYISHVITSPKPISFPNNQQRPRDLSNNSVKQFTSPNTHITHTLPNQVLSRLTEPNLIPVTTYTSLTSRYKPRQDEDSYHNVQQLDTNMSKMTVQKTQIDPEANRYISHINSSPQPLSLPNNQQRPRDLSNNSVKQFPWVGSSNENFPPSRGKPVSLNNRYKQTTKFPPNSPQIHLNEINNVNDDERNLYSSHYTTDINPSLGQIEPKSSYTITHPTYSPKPHPVYHNSINYKKLPLPHKPRHYDQSQHGEHAPITYLSELDPVLNGKLQDRPDSYKPNYIPNKQTTVKNNPVVVTKIKEIYSNEKLNDHSSDDAQEFIDHYQQNNVSPAMPVVHEYNQSGGMNKLYVDKNAVPPRSHQMTSDLTSSEINPLTASYPNVLGQSPYPAESQMKFPPTQSETALSNPDPTNFVTGRIPIEKDFQKRLKFEPSQVVNPDKKPHSTPSRHFQNTHLPGSGNHRPNDNFLHADNTNQNPLHHNRLPNNLPYPLQNQNLPVSAKGEKSPIKYNNPHVGHKNPSHFNPNQPQSIQKPQPHLETPYNYHAPRDSVTPRPHGFPNHANTVLDTHLPERNINHPLHLQPSPENINDVGLQHPLPLPFKALGPSNPKGFINQTPNYNQEQYPPRINPNQYPTSPHRLHQNNGNKNPNIYTDGQRHQRPDLQGPIQNNQNQNKYPIPNFEAFDSPSPQQSHPIPGLLDHPKTYDNYQYPMNSEYLPNLGNHPPNAQFPPTLNQPTSGISGNSAPEFAHQYLPPSQAVESLPYPHEPQSFDSYSNKNQHLELPKHQQTSKNIDSNEPLDFEIDNHTLDNLHTPPQLLFEPYSKENGLEYTDSGKNPNIKEYSDPHSPPLQENPNTSGNFDDPGSNDDYFLPEHNSPQNIYKIPHKENSSNVLDDTSEGFTYPPSFEDITHSNNLSEHPHPSTSSTDNPDFNIRGLDTGFEYISESTEDTTHTKRPISETEIPYNFDDNGSGGAYTSKSVENQNKSPWKPHISTTVSPRNRNPEVGEYKPFFNNSWSPEEVDKIHESESASRPKLNHDHNELEDGRAWNPTESENELLHINSNVLANLLSVANGTKNMNKLYPSLILLIESLTKPNLNNSEFDDSGLDEVDFLPVLLSILAKYQDDINKLNHKLYNSKKNNIILLEKITANEYKPGDEVDIQKIYDMLSELPTLNINITNINVTNDEVEEYLLKLIHNIQEKALETTTYPGDNKITINTIFKSSTPAVPHSQYPDLLKVLQEFQEADPLDLLALVNNLPVDNTSQGDGDDKPIKSRFSNPKPNHMFKGDGDANPMQSRFSNHKPNHMFKGDGDANPMQSRFSNPKPNHMFKGDGDVNPMQSAFSNHKPNHMFKGDGDANPMQSRFSNHKPNHMFKGDGDANPMQSRFSNHKPNHMFKYKLKDQKEECGDGTVWLKNCHECSCKSGHAYCIQIPDCVSRPLDEPMMCKPYTHFNMGACYTCECNADGIPECDGSNCAGHVPPMDEEIDTGKEFFDEEKTKEIIQYYNTYKKLPKECSDSSFLYQTCQPGTSWISDCHDCKCNDKGKHECTKTKECEMRNVHSYGGASKCKPNTKFYPKSSGMPCVECSCDDNGEPYCPTNDHRK